jgi:16S rRNA pseudouridine516 synthase
MRIDKLLSNLKYGSRAEIKKYVRQKRIKVNGTVIKTSDFKVDPIHDVILFDKEIVFYKERIVLMMNKPQGYVSANKDGLHQTVFDLVKEPYHRFDLKVAGRLDIDTEGLLLLTNDGEFIHNIIQPNKDVYKKYYVEVNQPFDVSRLLNPMEILDGVGNSYIPHTPIVEAISDTTFYLSIHEGKFHQVKRMCEFCGVSVVYLKRVSIGDIVLDEDLSLGEYKEL